MADVHITEYTDPGCPWAYSAEPFRQRLDWIYGGDVNWQVRMVVLSRSPEDYTDRGFTPERQASAFRSIARQHGMPIDTTERPRMAATEPACRAVVATRLAAPELTHPLLRALRVHSFAADALLDEPRMLELAAADVGIERQDLERWMADGRVQQELEEDMRAARQPMRAARVLDDKLANWSGGRRYTCPSYEITRVADGVTIAVPGFQPFAVYDVVLANLVPAADRRPAAQSAREVLEWASCPLATREVAVVADIEHTEAREQLGRLGHERHVGADGFWTLNGDSG